MKLNNIFTQTLEIILIGLLATTLSSLRLKSPKEISFTCSLTFDPNTIMIAREHAANSRKKRVLIREIYLSPGGKLTT